MAKPNKNAGTVINKNISNRRKRVRSTVKPVGTIMRTAGQQERGTFMAGSKHANRCLCQHNSIDLVTTAMMVLTTSAMSMGVPVTIRCMTDARHHGQQR